VLLVLNGDTGDTEAITLMRLVLLGSPNDRIDCSQSDDMQAA
jgi:hypothetical protein